MFGPSKPLYSNRLSRDIADLYEHDYACSSSLLSVDPDSSLSGVTLHICIFDGPYRGGHFSFYLSVPNNYPFKMVDVWAKHPIYHPNIDLLTGKVSLPLEWSPVLTLHSLAVAVQMMLLEPSSESILNNEACSYYASSPIIFEEMVQKTLRGGRYCDIDFPMVSLNPSLPFTCPYCGDRGNAGSKPGRRISPGRGSSSGTREIADGAYSVGSYDKIHDESYDVTMSLTPGKRVFAVCDDDSSAISMRCAEELTPLTKRLRSEIENSADRDDATSHMHSLTIDRRNRLGGSHDASVGHEGSFNNAAFVMAMEALKTLEGPRSEAAMVVDNVS